MGRREGGEERAAHPLPARKARPVLADGLVSVLVAVLPARRLSLDAHAVAGAGAGAGAGARGAALARWHAGTLARTPVTPRLHASTPGRSRDVQRRVQRCDEADG
jgi:hypothetical protein